MAVVLSLCAAPVFAAESAASKKETAQRKAEAADHYKKGVALFKEGDFGSALAEFKAAYQAVPGFEVLYNIGLTERRLFKYGQAVKTFARYLEEGGKKVPQDRRDSVESELSIIRSLTSKVTVKVDGAPAKVFVDGEVVGQTPLAEPVLLGPGKHALRATRDGEPDAEESIELASGLVREVTLVFAPKVSQGPVEVSVETDPRDAVLMVDGTLAGVSPAKLELTPGTHELIAEFEGYQSARTDVVVEPGKPRTVKLKLVAGASGAAAGRGRFPVVGVVLFGVAVAAGGLSALFGVQAGNASRQVTEFFRSGGAWDASRAAVEAQGLRDQTLAGVFIGVSAAALVGGVIATIVTVVAPADDAEARFFLVPTPSGVTAAWSTRF
ncbi:MAG: PEGA domain-containing protein [Myxococcaceae bacterium]|jgi:hypothetical protein|nr:PEGA domain-containing protein [Myxococcaceae bacterium]